MFEELIPLAPLHFFSFQFNCRRLEGKKLATLPKECRLPSLHAFQGELPLGEIAVAWHQEGLALSVMVPGAFEKGEYPDYTSGDALELFIDTRDRKQSGAPTRFCHHFFFLPTAVEMDGESVQAGEVTRFRGEERHELADPKLFRLALQKERRETILNLFIPAECLHGYDPAQFNRLGFTYRLHRAGKGSQSFAVNSEDFVIEQNPSLWASLEMR